MIYIIDFLLGERYDFILRANRSPKSYLIRAKGFADCSVNKVFETALLVYENTSSSSMEQLSYENMSRKGLVYKYLYIKFDV